MSQSFFQAASTSPRNDFTSPHRKDRSSQQATTQLCSKGLTELGESKVWRFFLQICLALEFIHEKGIVHADLKPSNLLLTGRDYVLKLTDFGVSDLSF